MEAIIYAIGFSVAAMILALPFIKMYANTGRKGKGRGDGP